MWGDYRLSAEELLARLEKGEPGFDRFVFSKIIKNSQRPSLYLPVLFSPEVLDTLFSRYLQMASHRKMIL